MMDNTLAKSHNLEVLAHRFGIPFLSHLQDQIFVKEKVRKLPYKTAKVMKALPIKEEEGIIYVAIADPLNLEVLNEIRMLLGSSISEVLTTEESLDQAIEFCYQKKEEETTRLIAELTPNVEKGKLEEGVYDLLENLEDSASIRIVNAILLEAIQQGASDVHFEPQESGLLVRYRIDGVLQVRHSPSKEMQSQIITRIKVMAQLDIAEQRLPQDGRIKLRVGGRTIDFRVSTVPIVFGERIVLRILDKGSITLGLNNIGMPDELLQKFKKYTESPEGIVLVTGPTGSGKTTTLYSALMQLNNSSMNIMTIEDPVEFKLPGMAQIGVNTRIQLSFGAGLRHILRQDPDIIMIGEIRDKETAEIAIQSSLTGHLVLSTLHTNDAPSAITRLIDMGIEPYLLSSSLIAVLAQRLVRMVCPRCKVGYVPSDREKKDLGLEGKKEALFFKGEGCEHCYQSGYKGRRAIYELMKVSYRIKQRMLQSVDTASLKKIALEEGFCDLRQAGAQLVLEGVTSATEVLRVVKSYSEEEI